MSRKTRILIISYGGAALIALSIFSAVCYGHLRVYRRQAGYDGLYNYEIPGENACPVEVRILKLAYLRRISDWIEANA